MNLDFLIAAESISTETIEEILLSIETPTQSPNGFLGGNYVASTNTDDISHYFLNENKAIKAGHTVIIGRLGGDKLCTTYKQKENGQWERNVLTVMEKPLLENKEMLDLIPTDVEFKDGQMIDVSGNEILVKVIKDENGYEEYFFM